MRARLSFTDLRQLFVFREVVRSKGFSAAQMTLQIRQSTISSHIKLLEDRLGFVLCERDRGEFKLTSAGCEVFEAIEAFATNLDILGVELSRITARLDGKVRIGIPHVLQRLPHHGAMDAVIASLAEAGIDGKLEINLCTQEALENGLIDGTFDLAVGGLSREARGLVYEELFEITAEVYCGKDHPLFSVPDDLIDEGVLLAQRSVMHDFDVAKQLPFVVENSVITESSEVSLMYILSGHYIGYLSDYVATTWNRRGLIRPIGEDRFSYLSSGGVFYRSDRQHSDTAIHARNVIINKFKLLQT